MRTATQFWESSIAFSGPKASDGTMAAQKNRESTTPEMKIRRRRTGTCASPVGAIRLPASTKGKMRKTQGNFSQGKNPTKTPEMNEYLENKAAAKVARLRISISLEP